MIRPLTKRNGKLNCKLAIQKPLRKRRLEIRAEIVKIIQNILNQGGQSEIVTSGKRAKAILQYINNTNTQLKYFPKWLVVPVILDELKKIPYRGRLGFIPLSMS